MWVHGDVHGESQLSSPLNFMISGDAKVTTSGIVLDYDGSETGISFVIEHPMHFDHVEALERVAESLSKTVELLERNKV